MGLDHGFTEVEAQPGSPGARGEGALRPVEALEDALLLLLGDADALVGDVDVYPILIGPAAHFDQSALRRIFDGVGEQVVQNLAQALGIAAHEGQVGGEVHREEVLLRLGAELLHFLLRQLVYPQVAELQLEGASLKAGGVQEVVNELVEAVALLHDDVQALPERFLVPMGVLAAQGVGVALDQRHGALQLVGDDGDEGGFHLLSLAKGGDVPHVGDDAHQSALIVIEGRVADAYRDGPTVTLDVSLHVEASLGLHQRAAGSADVLALAVAQGQHAVAGLADGLLSRPAGELDQGAVEDPDAAVAVKDHYPVGGILDDGGEETFLLHHLLVKPGVVDGDGRLVGEAGQHLAVVGRESPSPRAEDVDHADQLALHDHGQGHHLAQTQT